eukprot:PhF_6_TR40789/c0_g1_i3/m.61597/K03363/CDC20; cell division cycle 20, cofactor of APC complex
MNRPRSSVSPVTRKRVKGGYNTTASTTTNNNSPPLSALNNNYNGSNVYGGGGGTRYGGTPSSFTLDSQYDDGEGQPQGRGSRFIASSYCADSFSSTYSEEASFKARRGGLKENDDPEGKANGDLHGSAKKHKDHSYATVLRETMIGTSSSRILRFTEGMGGGNNNLNAPGTPQITTPSGSSMSRPRIDSVASSHHHERIQKIPNNPDRMLDAPGLVVSPFANVLSWANGLGGINKLAIALGPTLYSWDPDERKADMLYAGANDTNNARCVSWFPGHAQLAIGFDSSDLMIFDVANMRETGCVKLQDSTRASLYTVATCISWYHSTVMVYGRSDGKVCMYDPRGKTQTTFQAHSPTSSVCNIKFSLNENYFATSAYTHRPEDEKYQVVQIWDARKIGEHLEERPVMSLRVGASCKALAWVPWKHNALITGCERGVLSVWNTSSGATFKTVETGSGIGHVFTSQPYCEIVTTHYLRDGDSAAAHSNCTEMQLWSGKSLNPRAAIGKNFGVISADISANGETVCIATTEEALKFWELFPKGGAPPQMPKESDSHHRLLSNMSGSTMLR